MSFSFGFIPYFIGAIWSKKMLPKVGSSEKNKKKEGSRLCIEAGGYGGLGCVSSKPHSAHYVPSRSGFRIFLLNLSEEGIYRHHFDFFLADRHLRNKQTDNLLIFDAEMVIPKFLENLIVDF